ncbi:MAG: LytTR family DNA-binding domain-containing protein [Bacteroidota bacterium]
MKKYNAIIVDDEDNNLLLIKHFISKFCPNIDVIDEASSVESAINSIETNQPNILYLDIQLNSSNAFEILDQIDFSEIEVIFITAFDEYALKAFKYNAVDYLMKPLSIEDFIVATNKAIQRIEEKQIFNKQLTEGRKVFENQTSKYVTISSMDKVDIIKKEDLIFCKSDGRYTTFYLKNKTEILACKNLGEYEIILNDDSFFRVHHSYIVNLDYVININKKAGYYCEMVNGAFIPIAKRRQESLNKHLKINGSKSS